MMPVELEVLHLFICDCDLLVILDMHFFKHTNIRTHIINLYH